MKSIDPRAVIHPGAQIGQEVRIGPFAIIGEHVVIGDGCIIEANAVIRDFTTMGIENHVFQFASVGETPQFKAMTKGQSELHIGDRNTIRECATLNRGTPQHGGITRIGDDNFIMAYAHIAHDCIVANQTIFANGASLAGHVHVYDYAILGGYTMVHQFCHIGSHCITAIGTVTFKDIPPFVIASGNPAEPHGINSRGLRRRNFDASSIALIKKAHKLLYRQDLNVKSACEKILALSDDNQNLQHLCDFVKSSERGIIRNKHKGE